MKAFLSDQKGGLGRRTGEEGDRRGVERGRERERGVGLLLHNHFIETSHSLALDCRGGSIKTTAVDVPG